MREYFTDKRLIVGALVCKPITFHVLPVQTGPSDLITEGATTQHISHRRANLFIKTLCSTI